MEATTLMPAAFIGHGSPMNTLEINRYTSAWRDLGKSLAKPRAVLAVSAHWYVNGSAVTAVHNLGEIDWGRRDGSFDWGGRFDAAVKEIMTSAPGTLADVVAHRDFALSVPTAEHFLPLAYLAGLCAEAGDVAEVLMEGGTMGSITMTSYLLGGGDLRRGAASHAPAARLPDPVTVRPENTNA